MLSLYERVIAIGGGAFAMRDLGALEAAVAQPKASFGGTDLYTSLAEKAGALGFSLILNHPFVDGNKRVGHAALEVFLVLNGFELAVAVDESERAILDVAVGSMAHEAFVAWIASHLAPVPERQG